MLHIRIPRLTFAGILLSILAVHVQGQVFSAGPVMADRGEKASGYIIITEGVDEGTTIPISVIHGSKPGPVLALIAGVHGYEYPPVTALQNIRREIEPRDLSGTVIIVHVANMPSFLKRTIYYSPIDGKNLNREYPGRPDGTASERIAHAITTEVIDRADYVVDLHCGDGNEALRPYSYWMRTGKEELDTVTREMVIAFGLDHIVIDDDRPDDPGESTYTSNTALTRGKPGITTETGGLGLNDAASIQMAEDGVWNLMRYLKMLEGTVRMHSGIVWLDRYEVVRSPVTGIFQASVRDGYAVNEGALLGTLLDLFGNEIGEMRAPFSGIVNYVIATPPISEGEPVAMVSHIKPD
ncbi:M14 family metallopeptidase [Candidatus Zixiibacteriota bacterium]